MFFFFFFFFNDTATTEIYTLSLHDALPIPLLDRHLLQRRSGEHARVVDENVDPPKGPDDLADHVQHLALPRDVGPDVEPAPAQALYPRQHRRGLPLPQDISHGDVSPLGGEGLHDAAPYPPHPAGHYGDLALQPPIRLL